MFYLEMCCMQGNVVQYLYIPLLPKPNTDPTSFPTCTNGKIKSNSKANGFFIALSTRGNQENQDHTLYTSLNSHQLHLAFMVG